MLHRLLRDMVEQVTNFWVSPSSMICPFATFQYWFIGLLTVSMLPIVGAVPSSWSTPTNDAFKRDDGSMNASGTSGTVTTSTTSSTTLPTSSTNPKSDSWSDTHVVLLISREFAYGLIIGKFSCRCCLWPKGFQIDAGKKKNFISFAINMMWKGRLLTLFKVFTSIAVTIAIVLFLWKWWQKRRTRSFSVIGEKDQDHEPLSASFHPGELPELLYLPERAPARTPGLVWYFFLILRCRRYGRLVVVRAGTPLCLSS